MTIQMKGNVFRPLQLLLDMKVRWSSTYVMLDRAERNKEVLVVLQIHLSDAEHIARSTLTLLLMSCAGKKQTR
jgi:hypothetical protein